MPRRKIPLTENEHYHIYNRGTDKRDIFTDDEDIRRFLQCMVEFNVIEPIGSIYQNTFVKKNHQLRTPSPKLVEIVAYCLNPNHYHLILKQVTEHGISKFMQRIAGGYTNFFNTKYERSGVLFQGPFKSSHIGSDAYFTHVSAYVNLNHRVHQIEGEDLKFVRSSWDEYMSGGNKGMCSKDAILAYFKDKEAYRAFAERSVLETVLRRKKEKEWKGMLLD